jgi:long-chain acyl-CoA synthetase
VRLSDSGEILVRCPDHFDGYWNQPDATREIVDAESWLHTGDVGAWSDGRLRLVDRARDFIVTSGGKTISPSLIENLLRASPYVVEAVVFGHERKYLTAVVEIDFDTVADWARSRDVAYTGFTSLAQHAEVVRLIRSEIDKVNREPVTPTRKVKRKLMYDRFRALVDGMYDDSEERRLAAEVGEALPGAFSGEVAAGSP